MTTITEAFELPRPEDVRAIGFVIKLRELEPSSEEALQLAYDYVITPAVERALPRILDDMKQVFDRGEEYGRFIHGSFGSGKSHFMSMPSVLVEGAAPAWQKQQPLRAILAIDEEFEDADVPIADRIGLLDSAWRLLPDVAREDAAAATRLKAELQALVGPDGPSRELIEDWKKRFLPPTQRTPRAKKAAAARHDEESATDESEP